MNAFETGDRRMIPAVLVYVKSTDGMVLMIHRVDGAGRVQVGDAHSGKWNGLGGKLEPDESPLEGARRELREESGLELAEGAFRSLGTLLFPNFKAHRAEDWLVFLFTARLGMRADEAPPLANCAEGQLHWVAAEELAKLNVWPGDRFFIPFVIDERPFLGTIWYRGAEVARHWIVPLS